MDLSALIVALIVLNSVTISSWYFTSERMEFNVIDKSEELGFSDLSSDILAFDSDRFSGV